MLDGVMCAGSVGVGLCDAGKAEKATLRPHACARMQFFPDMRVARPVSLRFFEHSGT